MGIFLEILTELSARNTPIFSFSDDNLSKCQGSSTERVTFIDMKEIWFGIAYRHIPSMFDRVVSLLLIQREQFSVSGERKCTCTSQR